MTKIVIALSVLLLLLLAGNFGLVWAVVVYNTPTTLSSNVLTSKASGEPVQVSSADFYYDSNGLLQLRNRAAQVSMDWVGSAPASCSADASPAASCSSDGTSAMGGTGRRLLQDSGSTGASNTPTTVDMQTTQFTPVCNVSSTDFYTNSSYFFTGTCTFSKLVQMRTMLLPILSSKTSAQVGGSIIDAAAWKSGPQTVYKGCYNAGSPASSNWNQAVLSASTSLANCETLAVNGVDASNRPYSYFGFTGASNSTAGTCYACSAAHATCTPFQYGTGTCSNTAGIQVFQVLRSPNRYQNSGPGAMANSPTPIAGGAPAPPAWSFTTLAINRVDYVKNVFRDASNTLTICQANLLRFYVEPMITSGSVTSASGGNSSYIDICLTPMSKATPFGAGSTTWIGNYTVHSTGTSSVFSTSTSAPAYYNRTSVGTSFATPSNTDFQSVLSYFCLNCPIGPYVDYSNLQYDANLFELPCTKKGISWRYRDVYSNQGCPAWDPSNPSAQNNCTWTVAESTNYGGAAGPKYCILTLEAFTRNEPIYTFDNQLSFLANTGRSTSSVMKTQTATGDSGVPPLYNGYGSGSGTATIGPLWRDYFNTSDEADAVVSWYSWFSSANRDGSQTIVAGSRRRLLADPNVGDRVAYSPNGVTLTYVGDCVDTNRQAVNGFRSNPLTACAGTNSCYALSGKVCRCITGGTYGYAVSQFCGQGNSYCKAETTANGGGCYAASTAGSSSASILSTS